MVDQNDIDAANMLVKMAYGVLGTTGTQPSEEAVADSSDHAGKGKIKLRIQLREDSSSSELNQRKRIRNADKQDAGKQVEEELPKKDGSSTGHLSVRIKIPYTNTDATYRELASLPPPPAILMQPISWKERFKNLIKRRKTICTVKPSSEEVRSYFRREEALRYALPERAFFYTALDGRKSTVAPAKNSSGKLLMAREHYMLKSDRPVNVTVLCVVRDAAARLPGRIGTKADICVLVRDSQFVDEDVSDEQLIEVVGAAIDRLRAEEDPCLKYDRLLHLWVYLHAQREDGEFINQLM